MTSLNQTSQHGLIAFAALLVALAATGSPAIAQTGIQFDGANDYVTFGQAAPAGVSTFTLEIWFYKEGPGVTASTGTGGVVAIPLLTKGRGEADGNTKDMNFFLGIRGSDNVLVADFEEGTGQTSPGLNHPVAGMTPIRENAWYHAAATYDGTTWRLYLNGHLEAELVVGANRLPQSGSIQHAGLATAMNSGGSPSGYFKGVLDEARIWNYPRSQSAIADTMGIEVGTAPGLVARWGLNDGTSTTAVNSVPGGPDGTLTNGPAWVPGTPFAVVNSLVFGSSSAYVTFGDPAALDLAQFTLETWFRRDGTGTAVTTGGGGIVALPLITKGAAEVDGNNKDMNYFLGIRDSDNVLVADFEEGAGSSPGLNHPIAGVTPISAGVWYHAAATYNGTTWSLYLNGVLENSLVVGEPAQSASIQPAGLGTSLKSDGSANGHFDGTLDEVRVWDHARTLAEIEATINDQLPAATAGLVGRWALDEGGGGVVYGSAGTTIDGTLSGSGWAWDDAAPFDIAIGPPQPPDPPSGLTLTPISHVRIDLGWLDNSNNERGFEIHRSILGPGGPFDSLTTTAAGVTSYTDGTLSPETGYCYRVRSVNGAGESAWTPAVCDSTPAEGEFALDFAGSGTYVTFGNPAQLGLGQFTLEAWFRRDGAGATANTGTGGFYGIPLITKGVGEADGDNRDMNYFFGIHGANGVLAADFEEGGGGSSPGLNHPIEGTTPIATGVWYHAAVTYDGSSWTLYLDGNIENQLTAGEPPQSSSIQHAGLAVALNSTGGSSGFFDGVLDEVRVWDHARTQTQVRATINSQIDAAQPGLVARWSLNEGAGTSVGGSVGTAVTGAISGSSYSWVAPAPFNILFNDPPDMPVLNGPAHMATGVAIPPVLGVGVSDPEATAVDVAFYGRAATLGAGPPFTLIVMPDTQFYSAEMNGATAAIFTAQTQWIVDNKDALNIVFVDQVGDCVQNGDSYEAEWQNADAAMSLLEDSLVTSLPFGVPFSIDVGNHDQSPQGDADGTTTFYNQYFGETRFLGRDYYGGHFGANNDNRFSLFSASGYDFIVISLEYDTSPNAGVLSWADSLLAAHPGRWGILSSHNLIGAGNPASFDAKGLAIYNAVKGNPNLFLMLCGHVSGEGRRTDVYDGNTVHTVMADYQSRANGGDGWLRIMTFYPDEGLARVKTYSPTRDQFETDADSQFELPIPIQPLGGWQWIGTNTGVPSGNNTSLAWPGLDELTEYEWYATASDSVNTTTGDTWRFTTQSPPVPVLVSGLSARSVEGGVELTWSLAADEELAGIRLQRDDVNSGGVETLHGDDSYLPPDTRRFVDLNADAGTTYRYTLIVTTSEGDDYQSAPVTVTTGGFRQALYQNHPNPFNPSTSIGYSIAQRGVVTLRVYNTAGQLVRTLVDEVQSPTPGGFRVDWDGRNERGARVASGVYLYKLTVGGKFTAVKKLVLLK